MYLESFRHLIEIEALKSKKATEHSKIVSENKRISDLQNLREKRTQEISELDQKLRELKLTEKELSIDSNQTKLKRMISQLDLVTKEKEQQALEHQIDTLKKETQDLEVNYFSSLEMAESFEAQKKENAQFLAGSIESLKTITQEVDQAVNLHRQEMDKYQLRIDSLMELLHPSMRALYLELETKFKPHRPVAYVVDHKCSHCHTKLDSQADVTVEQGRTLVTCFSCSHLLIPESAKIY